MNELSVEYAKAVDLDRKIKVSAQLAQQSLYDMCRGLKEMRDNKLYKELGYQNFEEYCENEVGISRMQCHKYVSIVDAFSENVNPGLQNIGVSKLYLLSKLSDEERTEIAKKNDLEEISKRELENQIKQLKEEKSNKDKQYKELEEVNYNLREQIEDLENRPIEVAVAEPSHEVENMRKAMITCDKQWAEKYSQLEEESLKCENELHQKITQLTADYEEKLLHATKKTSANDVKEIFRAYYTMAYNSFTTLISFIRNQDDDSKSICMKKSNALIDALKKSLEDVKHGKII